MVDGLAWCLYFKMEHTKMFEELELPTRRSRATATKLLPTAKNGREFHSNPRATRSFAHTSFFSANGLGIVMHGTSVRAIEAVDSSEHQRTI
jgi:hypothetical protein